MTISEVPPDCTFFFAYIYPDLVGTGPFSSLTCCDKQSTNLICDLNNQLSIIDLNNNHLEGYISDSIGELTNLRIINLSQNNLTGMIPSSIEQLTKLQELKLNSNQMTGYIPNRIDELIELKELYLNENLFYGKIPDTIGNLSSLVQLDLTMNDFNGTIPKSIQIMNNYTNFKFDNKNLIDSIDIKPNMMTTTYMNDKIMTSIPTSIGNEFDQTNEKQLNIPLIIVVLLLLIFILLFTIINQHQRHHIEETLQNSKKNSKITTTISIPSINNVMIDSIEDIQVDFKKKSIENDDIVINPEFGSKDTLKSTPSLQNIQRPKTIKTDKSNSEPILNEKNSINQFTGSVMYDIRLVIKKKIAGAGGCGQVFLATYAGKEAVAKIPIEKDHEILIYNESRIMKLVECPWTIKALTFLDGAPIKIPGQINIPRTVLLLEYMDLGSLSTYLTPNPPPDQYNLYNSVKDQMLPISIMFAKGLEYIHQQGLCHLDVKPENVLLKQSEGGQIIAKVSDFGSCKPNGSREHVFQTSGYIPPEGKQDNEKTYMFDVYAFGCSMIYMLTNENYPFLWEGGHQSIQGKQRFLSSILINTKLVDMIISSIHHDPQQRPNMTFIIKQLNEFQKNDFEMITFNKINTSILMSCQPTIKTTKLNSSIDYQNTPGQYLFKLFDLQSPTTLQQFHQSFHSIYSPTIPIPLDMFKQYIQSNDDMVTSQLLDQTIFKTMEPLLDGDVDIQQIWIDEIHHQIQFMMDRILN